MSNVSCMHCREISDTDGTEQWSLGVGSFHFHRRRRAVVICFTAALLFVGIAFLGALFYYPARLPIALPAACLTVWVAVQAFQVNDIPAADVSSMTSGYAACVLPSCAERTQHFIASIDRCEVSLAYRWPPIEMRRGGKEMRRYAVRVAKHPI